MDEKKPKFPAGLACEAISQPWAMLPEWMPHVMQAMSKAEDDDEEKDAVRALVDVNEYARLAVVHVEGALMKGAPSWYSYFGILNHDLVMQVCDEILASADSVETVVFCINSPGGTVNGTPELCQRIEALGKAGMTTIAYTDKLCASAGYQLASACEAIFSAPTALVGSIGVIRSFATDKEMWAQMGVKWETFASSPLKAAGYPGRDLTDAERTFIQSQVNLSGEEFTSYVRSRRAGIEAPAFNGQPFQARFAPAGMVDNSTFATLKDLLKQIAAGDV